MELRANDAGSETAGGGGAGHAQQPRRGLCSAMLSDSGRSFSILFLGLEKFLYLERLRILAKGNRRKVNLETGVGNRSSAIVGEAQCVFPCYSVSQFNCRGGKAALTA